MERLKTIFFLQSFHPFSFDLTGSGKDEIEKNEDLSLKFTAYFISM